MLQEEKTNFNHRACMQPILILLIKNTPWTLGARKLMASLIYSFHALDLIAFTYIIYVTITVIS